MTNAVITAPEAEAPPTIEAAELDLLIADLEERIRDTITLDRLIIHAGDPTLPSIICDPILP